jgi:hypothetical protein
LAGCAAQAETRTETAPVAQKYEVTQRQTAAAAQTPEMRLNRNPYAEMPQDGDLEYSMPAPNSSSPLLNKTVFDKIKPGMTLEAVEKLLDEKGMLVSTMDVNGRKTQIYKWSNDDFSRYIDVTIEKGKVVEKKDKGLK